MECVKNVFLLAAKLNILPTDPQKDFTGIYIAESNVLIAIYANNYDPRRQYMRRDIE